MRLVASLRPLELFHQYGDLPLRVAACGEPAGSISAGTGFPVVRERETGRYFHVRCRPGSPSGKAAVVFAGVV